MTSARRARLRWALVAASVVASLLIAETVIRATGLAPALPEQYRDFIRDPYLAFRKEPNVVRRGTSRSKEYDFEYRHNSEGFRDREHPIEKADGVFRILALGDSFTWGVGAAFEETYLARLETMLNDRGPGHPEIEIIKAGQPRYFPEIERRMLEVYAPKYDPDLVMVAFLPNDIKDTALGMDALRTPRSDGYLFTQRSARVGSLGTWLYLNVHLARLVLSAYLSLDEAPRPSPGDLPRENVGKSWELIKKEYRRMSEIARDIGAAFVVIHIPLPNLSPDDGYALHARLGRSVDAFVDTQPALLAVREASGRFLYWPKDGHCDADGYRVIAETLFRELTSQELVP